MLIFKVFFDYTINTCKLDVINFTDNHTMSVVFHAHSFNEDKGSVRHNL